MEYVRVLSVRRLPLRDVELGWGSDQKNGDRELKKSDSAVRLIYWPDTDPIVVHFCR